MNKKPFIIKTVFTRKWIKQMKGLNFIVIGVKSWNKWKFPFRWNNPYWKD
jgi:hypothetical protein